MIIRVLESGIGDGRVVSMVSLDDEPLNYLHVPNIVTV